MKALIIDAADYSFDFLMEPRAPHDLEADPLQLGDALVGEVEACADHWNWGQIRVSHLEVDGGT